MQASAGLWDGVKTFLSEARFFEVGPQLCYALLPDVDTLFI